MRIAIFTETYIPDVNGVVAHVKTLKEGLEELGHTVLIVAADKHCKHHYIHDGVLHCPSLEVKRLYGFGVAFPYSRRRLRLIADFNPDVVHIHHEFGIGLSGILAAKLFKKPLVYTLHTMYDQYIYYIAPKPFLKAATKFSHKYERFIATNATMLTGPSEKCVQYFKAIGIKKEVNLIPNSADIDAFDYRRISDREKTVLRKKLNIPEDRMVICFAGRLGKEKSVDVLLHYMAETLTPEDNVHLLVIGDGLEKLLLIQLAKQLGIDEFVTFTGAVPHSDMPFHFAISDVFATASLSEMNSISMLESMAMGLPVLQRYDELNASQIAVGINGVLYHTAKEFAAEVKKYRDLTYEEKQELKETVRATVVSRGSKDLANYMLKVYTNAVMENKQRQNKHRKI